LALVNTVSDPTATNTDPFDATPFKLIVAPESWVTHDEVSALVITVPWSPTATYAPPPIAISDSRFP